MMLPRGCALVGVEITDDAVELPSFHHPKSAAYILGPERGILDPELVARCDHVVRITTKFSINVGLAGALVMYDRLMCMGLFAPRPHRPGGPTEPAPVPTAPRRGDRRRRECSSCDPRAQCTAASQAGSRPCTHPVHGSARGVRICACARGMCMRM